MMFFIVNAVHRVIHVFNLKYREITAMKSKIYSYRSSTFNSTCSSVTLKSAIHQQKKFVGIFGDI